jgi:DNA primase
LACIKLEDNLIIKFTDDWIASLKDRINIVDFLGKYMFVARAGNKYKACCPFHQEKTPSFIINPDEGYYHCFGCGKSGNVISFLMEHERLSYPEALESLAKYANMKLPENETHGESQDRLKKEEGYEVLRVAALFYHACLVTDNIGATAREYLKSRNITEQIIKNFGIGYSPDYTSLVLHLMSKGYTREQLKYVGLVHESNDGNLIDFFAKRLIIPIMSPFDKVIAFGGRALDEATRGGKYKNSEETPLFLKRNTLFGVNLFKRNRTKENFKFVILVEGYMDAISLYQAGIRNVVASMGTALHVEQCKALKKLIDTVYVCFDGDTAGREATWKSLSKLEEAKIDVRVISLPDGMDPDDVVKQKGLDYFLNLITIAMPMYDFMIKSIAAKFNLNLPDDIRKFTKEATVLLVNLDPISQDAYIKLIAEISNISDESIKTTLRSLSAPARQGKKDVSVDPSQNKAQDKTVPEEDTSLIDSARFVLSMFFAEQSAAILNDIREEFFEYEPHVEIYKYIVKSIDEKKTPKVGDLFDLIRDYPNEPNEMITAVDSLPASERGKKYRDSLANLNVRVTDRRIQEILPILRTTQDPEEKEKAHKEYMSLLQIKKVLNNNTNIK